MRSIYLCDKKQNIDKVYAETATSLTEAANLSDTIYTKNDVLASSDAFCDVSCIFSTWGMPAFTEEEIKRHFPALKAVFYAAGTVQAFARPFLHCGVRVFSAWAANGVPVAEYTVSQIILANKGFFAHTREMKRQNLEAGKILKASYPGNYDERVGIIGVGMIGSLVASMLKSYHLKVMAFDPFLPPERAEALGVELCSLETLFSSCRVVTNHLANNNQTRGMLNEACFSRMLPYATFLNTGRGAQIVEDDLVKVLRERPDLTAVLDVTYPEPPVKDHPFYTLDNCFLTPHIAGSLCMETHRMAEYMADEFARFKGGLPCRYEVNEKMLLTMA